MHPVLLQIKIVIDKSVNTSTRNKNTLLSVIIICLGMAVVFVLRQSGKKDDVTTQSDHLASASVLSQPDGAIFEPLKSNKKHDQRLDQSMTSPRFRHVGSLLPAESITLTNLPPPRNQKAEAAGPHNVKVGLFTGTIQSSLMSGQTLVSGGWPTADGKRTLAFATPTVTTEGNVLIEVAYLQVPEEMLTEPGWEQFRAVTSETSASGVLTPQQEEDFLGLLPGIEGASLVSTPRVLTGSGQAASISIEGGDGNSQTFTVMPTIFDDGQGVHLVVSNVLQHTLAKSR